MPAPVKGIEPDAVTEDGLASGLAPELAPELALQHITRQLGLERPPPELVVSSDCQSDTICVGLDGPSDGCPSAAWTCTAYYGVGPGLFDYVHFPVRVTQDSTSGAEWLTECFAQPHACVIHVYPEQAAYLCSVDGEHSGVYLRWLPETKRLVWLIWEGPPYEDIDADIDADDRHCTDAHGRRD